MLTAHLLETSQELLINESLVNVRSTEVQLTVQGVGCEQHVTVGSF